MTTPAINVNTTQCDCLPTGNHPTDNPADIEVRHSTQCASRPILIPCPIPRSVTFEVGLGGPCSCASFGIAHGKHAQGCKGAPVNVSCSISGETWEGSEVDDASGSPDLLEDDKAAVRTMAALEVACRARWEIVKALVTGYTGDFARFAPGNAAVVALRNQRDTVFAKLAKVRAHEDGLYDALGELPGEIAGYAGRPVDARFDFAERALASYVASLVASVGTL
jgi:hypothetical protein